MIVASEFGVLDLDASQVVQKGRLQPGKMFLVDTEAGRLISDEEIKHQVACAKPYAEWLTQQKISIASLPGLTYPGNTFSRVLK